MAIDILKRTAVHEAGHVLVAYALGYSVGYTFLDIANPGAGHAHILWAPDNSIVNILTNPILASERGMVSTIDRDVLSELVERFVIVNAAGTAAEFVCEERNGIASNISSMSAADNDLIGIFLDNLRTVDFIFDSAFVNRCFQIAHRILSKDECWTALDGLSDMLVADENHRLERSEIEVYLTGLGFAVK